MRMCGIVRMRAMSLILKFVAFESMTVCVILFKTTFKYDTHQTTFEEQ